MDRVWNNTGSNNSDLCKEHKRTARKTLRTAGAAGQGSVARLPTGGDGIDTAFSFGVAQLQQLG